MCVCVYIHLANNYNYLLWRCSNIIDKRKFIKCFYKCFILHRYCIFIFINNKIKLKTNYKVKHLDDKQI